MAPTEDDCSTKEAMPAFMVIHGVVRAEATKGSPAFSFHCVAVNDLARLETRERLPAAGNMASSSGFCRKTIKIILVTR
jgi:hypothetical protein